jgi:hypothetical protein
MMRAMAPRSEEPQSPGSNETDLDPEDAFLEEDEHGFLVSEGRSWHLPTDLDAWVMWAALVAVAVATLQTLAALAAGSLAAWAAGAGDLPLPLPAGYYSLILLGGIVLLVVRREADAVAGRERWVRGAACLVVGTGSCLIIAQLAGNIGLIVRPPGEGAFGVSSVTAATDLVTAIGGFADVIASAVAAALGFGLFRWSSTRAVEESRPGAVPGHTGGGGPALASALLGVAVAAVALIAFQVGVANNPNDLLSPLPSHTPTPSYSLLPYTLPLGQAGAPSGCTREESGQCIGGSTPTAPSASPAP